MNGVRRSTTMCLVTDMDNEQALADLERWPAATSSERLLAARFLARNETNQHRNRLSKIREAERNSWVRRALDQALKRSEIGDSVASTVVVGEIEGTPFPDVHQNEELRAQAIEETSALFLHELRPLVGLLERAAASEIGRYDCSRTKVSVDRVRSFLGAIEKLGKASAPPAIQEFDLTDLVIRAAADESMQGRATLYNFEQVTNEDVGLDDEFEHSSQQPVVKLSFARQDPVVTTGDPTLVGMALANALRNAIEAVLEVTEADRNEVVLNWGITDVDSWIAVLDEGCGLPMGWDHLADPGTSTKPKSQGHLGMGLPIAQKAMESARGSLRLTPRPSVGVSCEIRWPREGIVE